MKVSDLIAELQKMPQDLPVFRDNGDDGDGEDVIREVEYVYFSDIPGQQRVFIT